MPIYKNNPSPASLKRKAEDIDDGFDFEQGNKPRQDRVTKKAKPASGYVPGTGKPYRGTAMERPKASPSRSVGVLGDKSTNAPLKRREAVAKQDTKNLNRNAQKPKVPSGVSARSPCHITLTDNAHVEWYQPRSPEAPRDGKARDQRKAVYQQPSTHKDGGIQSGEARHFEGCQA